MSIYSQVYPTEQNPGKFQIEQLFRNMTEEQITPQVIKDFGLTRSSFDDEWKVTIPLNQARNKFRTLYDSLPPRTKVCFQLAFLAPAIGYANTILKNIEAALEKPDCLEATQEQMHDCFLAVGTKIQELTDTE